MTKKIEDMYDVAIIGGGAAGLSAALMLGRARRSVVVIDAGEPRNAPAAGVHGFLTRDGINPSELLRIGRAEAESYGGNFIRGNVSSARRNGHGFSLELDDGSLIGARRLLLATGIVDELPKIPGLRERWGKDVLHCPYCHGWEVRDQKIGIVGSSSMAVHLALLFRQWSNDITLFLNTAPQPTGAEREQLAARGISVVAGEIESLEVVDDSLAGVVLADGSLRRVQALAVSPVFNARAEVLEGLGVSVSEHPMGVGTYVESDASGKTSVPGVWVAGNVADVAAQVIMAAAGGAKAAGMINADLMAEELQAAVAAYRDPFSARSEARNAERVLGDRRHGLEVGR